MATNARRKRGSYLVASLKDEKRRLAQTLRFGPPSLRAADTVFAKFIDIAKILDISYSEARALTIIAHSIMHISHPREGSHRSKFAADHIGYILSEQTLQEWAARTLKERCVLFHRRFPEVSISKSSLQKIYKENKVKQKAITCTKKKKGLGSEKYEAILLMMRSEVMEALESKKKIISSTRPCSRTRRMPCWHMHPIGRTYAWTRSYHPPQPSRWSRVCQWRGGSRPG